MSLKAKIEAILYAAEEPVSAEQILTVLHEAGLVGELMAGAETDASAEQDAASEKKPPKSTKDKDPAKAERAAQRARVKAVVKELEDEYLNNERGMEVRSIAGGFRIATKAEHHDVVRSFARSLKPPVRLSIP